MAIIQINGITLPCTPASQFSTQVEISLQGQNIWTVAGVIATNPNGVFVAPLIISGLADGTAYDIRYTTTISGSCPFTDTHTTPAATTTTTTTSSTTTTTTAAPTTTTTTSTTTSSTTTTTTCCYVSDAEYGIFECCPPGYNMAPDQSVCVQEQMEDPNIIQSAICLAESQHSNYSSTGTFVYDFGFALNLTSGTFTALTNVPLWKDSDGTNGPMNRNSVWVDTDCDGTKDALTVGQVLQFSAQMDSLVGETVHVGIGGDNTYKLVVNGVTIVSNQNPATTANFNIWHIVPVVIPAGTSYFVFSFVGDGSTTDAGAGIIYRNSNAQIQAAASEADLDIVFKSGDLVGDVIDIAECNVGFNLDTSGGSGNYICRMIVLAATEDCLQTTTTTSSTTTTTTSAPQSDLFGTGLSTGAACFDLSTSPATLYWASGVFGPGKTLFANSSLTTPFTGSSFVAWDSNSTVYNINIGTGVVGSSTGIIC